MSVSESVSDIFGLQPSSVAWSLRACYNYAVIVYIVLLCLFVVILYIFLQLPDEEGRLLIMHGTMDENVHFMQVD